MASVDNATIARAFDELADLLELDGENPFKLRAYRNFAETTRELLEPLADVAARGELTQMDGVGKAIAGKVEEMLAKGTFEALERARMKVPKTLLDVMKLPGFGAKSVRTVWQEAHVTTLEEFVQASDKGTLEGLPGIGKKKVEKARRAALELLAGGATTLLYAARDACAVVTARLVPEVAREVVATGEVRRAIALVHDVVLLARGGTFAAITERLARAAPALELLSPEDGEVVAVTASGIRLHIRPVPEEDWVHALFSTTGDAEHVRELEDKAGGADAFAEICRKAADEASAYAALGLAFVPPELRDRHGEAVPADLVSEVFGIFHAHTTWSDGKASIVDMARAAEKLGLSVLGVSEHSRAASYANGLDEARLREQRAAIEEARKEVPGITLLHGVEVDIHADGSLDFDDELLGSLDFVVASVHTQLEQPIEEMTRRLVRALGNPLVTILGHPTGRLLRARKGATFDVEAVAKAAAANDTYLEINGNGHRLDLSDEMARAAALAGAKFVVNPDAHSVDAVADTLLGVAIARRAGLSRAQVLNAQPRDALLRTLSERRARAHARLA